MEDDYEIDNRGPVETDLILEDGTKVSVDPWRLAYISVYNNGVRSQVKEALGYLDKACDALGIDPGKYKE